MQEKQITAKIGEDENLFTQLTVYLEDVALNFSCECYEIRFEDSFGHDDRAGGEYSKNPYIPTRWIAYLVEETKKYAQQAEIEAFYSQSNYKSGEKIAP